MAVAAFDVFTPFLPTGLYPPAAFTSALFFGLGASGWFYTVFEVLVGFAAWANIDEAANIRADNRDIFFMIILFRRR